MGKLQLIKLIAARLGAKYALLLPGSDIAFGYGLGRLVKCNGMELVYEVIECGPTVNDLAHLIFPDLKVEDEYFPYKLKDTWYGTEKGQAYMESIQASGGKGIFRNRGRET